MSERVNDKREELARNLFFSFSREVSFGVGSEITVFWDVVFSELDPFGNEKLGIPRKDLRDERLLWLLEPRKMLPGLVMRFFRMSKKLCFLLADGDWPGTCNKADA